MKTGVALPDTKQFNLVRPHLRQNIICGFQKMKLPAASYGVSNSLFGTFTRGKPRGIKPRDRLKSNC